MSPASSKVIDFTNVKERSFNIRHLPEGEYKMKIVKVEDHESKQGNDQWLFTFRIESGPGKGASYPYYCGQDADQAWKIRNIYTAVGVTIPKKKFKVDPNKLVGRFVGVELVDDEYEGKTKSVVANIIPVSDIGADEDADEDDVEDLDEDEEPAPAKKSKKKAAAEEDKPAPKAKKKKSKPAVDDDELEELDIDEL